MTGAFPPQYKVFGKQAAAQFELGKTKDGRHAINVEVAPKQNQGYGWQEKSAYQLADGEIGALAAVMLRQAPQCRIVRDGKWLAVTRQPEHWFIQANDNGRQLAVQIGPEDGFMVGTLLLQGLTRQTGLDGSALVALLRCFNPKSHNTMPQRTGASQ